MKVSALNYLEQIFSKFPKKAAIDDENCSITFSELKELAIKIAITINNYINRSNKPIGVLLPKSKQSIVFFLVVNYSGNLYIPLDTKSPNIDYFNKNLMRPKFKFFKFFSINILKL